MILEQTRLHIQPSDPSMFLCRYSLQHEQKSEYNYVVSDNGSVRTKQSQQGTFQTPANRLQMVTGPQGNTAATPAGRNVTNSVHYFVLDQNAVAMENQASAAN